jgi:hypothetical protein
MTVINRDRTKGVRSKVSDSAGLEMMSLSDIRLRESEPRVVEELHSR